MWKPIASWLACLAVVGKREIDSRASRRRIANRGIVNDEDGLQLIQRVPGHPRARLTIPAGIIQIRRQIAGGNGVTRLDRNLPCLPAHNRYLGRGKSASSRADNSLAIILDEINRDRKSTRLNSSHVS